MPVWTSPSSGLWSDPTRWSGGIPNGIGAVAEFNASAAFPIGAATIAAGTSVTIGTLNAQLRDGANARIAGQFAGLSELHFNGGAGNAVVTIDIVTPSGVSSAMRILGYDVLSGTSYMTVHLDTNTIFNVINASPDTSMAIEAPIVGTGKLIKQGAGILGLSGNSTFSGGADVTAGTLFALGANSLGTGTVTISNNARLFIIGNPVANTIATIANATGAQGNAVLAGSGGTQFTGVLSHLSQGTLTFGAVDSAGEFAASFSNIQIGASGTAMRVTASTLLFGNAYNAANLFVRAGTGLTELTANAVIDTRGFAAIISNLDFDSGRIQSTGGALNVTVNDVLTVTQLQSGVVAGTAGIDQFTVNAANGFSLSSIGWNNWTAGTDLITLNGSANNNVLTGSTQRETINGFDGNDILISDGGIDMINGGAGNDNIQLIGASAGSFVDGGSGIDQLRIDSGLVTLGSLSGIEDVFVNSGGTLALSGGQVTNGLSLTTVVAGGGNIGIQMSSGIFLLTKAFDFTSYIGIVNVTGTIGNDIIKVGNATHAIFGSNGSDLVQGGNLIDTINGGNDNDKIAGNGAADVLTGGSGADVFKYRNVADSGLGVLADQITDFLIGTDRLNFVRIDANAAVAGDQAFSFIGTAEFAANGQGQIRYTNSGADLQVRIDSNGDGLADMAIVLQGLAGQTLTVADFVL
jgi:serralysin